MKTTKNAVIHNLSANNPQCKCGKVRHNIYIRSKISHLLKKFAVEKEFTISDAVDYILDQYLSIYMK